MDHAYWGPHFDTGGIDALLNERSAEIADAGSTVETIVDAVDFAGALRWRLPTAR